MLLKAIGLNCLDSFFKFTVVYFEINYISKFHRIYIRAVNNIDFFSSFLL